jgi:hypothetical protein
MTVDGNSRDTIEAIEATDARLGATSAVAHRIDGDVRFLDFPFTDESATFQDHFDRVIEYRPTLTVAPDVEKGRQPEDVYHMAEDLNGYADAVVVVPKDVHPSEVPGQFRVGVTLANFGSSAPWSLWDYRDCGPVHLLGGPPSRQIEAAHYLDVASVDTSTLGMRCHFGTWDRESGARDAPDGWDYSRRLEHALSEYAAAWGAAE